MIRTFRITAALTVWVLAATASAAATDNPASAARTV